MGVDLTFHVIDCDAPPHCLASSTRLSIGKEHDLLDRLDCVESLAVAGLPCPVHGHFEDGYEEAPPTDPYGRTLQYLEAGQIVEIAAGVDCGHRAKAALAYLAAMPPATKVILYYS